MQFIAIYLAQNIYNKKVSSRLRPPLEVSERRSVLKGSVGLETEGSNNLNRATEESSQCVVSSQQNFNKVY